MNKVKHDILADALRRIALASGKSDPKELAHIATTALQDAAAVIEYRITARTWYGRNGGEFRAELCRTDTGEKIIGISGGQWGVDAWAQTMRDAMHAQRPDLFPDPALTHPNPTRYFRETCNVPYSHTEVQRKKDL